MALRLVVMIKDKDGTLTVTGAENVTEIAITGVSIDNITIDGTENVYQVVI